MPLSAATPMIFVNVPDREASRSFYRDLLGLTLTGADEYGDMYDLGAARLRITPMPDHAPSPHPVLGFDLADIQAGVAELRGKGIGLTIYEGMGQDADGVWHAPDGTAKVAWFPDPFGNVLSLSQLG